MSIGNTRAKNLLYFSCIKSKKPYIIYKGLIKIPCKERSKMLEKMEFGDRLDLLMDSKIGCLSGFLRFEGWKNADGSEISQDLKDAWEEFWQEEGQDNFAFFPNPEEAGDSSQAYAGFHDFSKILEAHCNCNEEINQSYIIMEDESFWVAICKSDLIQFAKENENKIIAHFSLI